MTRTRPWIGVFAIAVVLTSAFAIAEPLEFSIDSPDQNMRGVVVSLDWPAGEPTSGSLRAQLDAAGDVPATIRDGRVLFVVPRIKHGKTTTGRIARGQAPGIGGGVVVAPDASTDSISVRVGEELVTRYWHRPKDRKPYLWPVNTAGEVGITRDWPMGERVRTFDHEHHQSMWTAYGDLNGADFWEYNERTGWERTESVACESGDAVGGIKASNVWVDADQRPVVRETRELRFYSGDPERRMVDLDVTLTAAYGAVYFKDTKEGGFIALRIRDELRERGGSGTITNSEGGVGARECWGKPAAWLDYSGELEGAGIRGVAIFDHPTSFRHPTYWHARDYGLVGANPFGLHDFTRNRLKGDYTLPDGESVSFHYRMLLHTDDVKKANVEEYYSAFAHPPAAHWTTATP